MPGEVEKVEGEEKDQAAAATPASSEQSAGGGAADKVDGAAAGEDGKSADSSTAKGEKYEPKSVLDAVTLALAKPGAEDGKGSEKKAAEGSPGSASGQSKSDGSDKGAPDSKTTKGEDANDVTRFTDEEWGQLSGKTKKAVRRFREQIKTLQGEVAEHRQDADAMHHLRTGLHTAGVTQQDFSTALTVLRLSKDDPAKALDALRGMVKELEAEVGDVLPEDLQAKVKSGTIDDETAKELSRKRREAARHDRRSSEEAARRNADERARKEDEAGRENAQKVVNAIKVHCESWQRTDPDYSKLEPVVRKRVGLSLRALAAEGKVLTPSEAVDHLKDLIEEVRDEIRELTPSRESKLPLRGGAPNSAARPAPKTMLEAVDAGLAASTTG